MKLFEACQVVPPSTVYSYVPYPPAAPLIIIVPSESPKHVTFVLTTVAESAGGSIITSNGSSTRKHVGLAASLILTSYEPDDRLIYEPVPCHVPPPLILYWYVPNPPVGADIVIVPLFALKHVILVLARSASS